MLQEETVTTNIRPLNLSLHRRLVATFKHVRVHSPGKEVVKVKVYDQQKGRVVDSKLESGEQYAVCCPMCNDTRFRLHISYLYGQDSHDGKYNQHLAYCFNLHCPLNSKEPEAYRKLYDMLTGRKLFDLSKAAIALGDHKISDVPITWPGEVVRVDTLDPGHECRRYLEVERNFDVGVLARSYNVHYCTESKFKMCKGKIIVPIYFNSKMVGWQARCCFDVDDWKTVYTPKYYTAPNMPKSAYWYNLDAASKCNLGVAVEGVTDVWRIGSPAVCSLGAMPSEKQVQLIVKHFREKPFVWLSDGDVWDESSKVSSSTRQKLEAVFALLRSRLKSGFCVIKLPPSMDPAKFTSREYLRGYISHHAKKEGIDLDWSVSGV